MPTEEFALAGARGEPVDLWRTLASHGFAGLPPMRLDEEARTLETTLPLARGRPRTVRIGTGPNGAGRIQVLGPVPSQASLALVRSGGLPGLRMDEDLSGFYSATAGDPGLPWFSRGAGGML